MALPSRILVKTKEIPLRKLFVLSEQVIVTIEPKELVTILGSCVSVCLWDRKRQLGGMNHFLLPETVNQVNSLKGGIESTRRLIDAMIAQTFVPKNFEAQIFGGANRFFKDENFLNVGRQNVEAAKIVLAEARIPIVHQDTGGESGRKIYFNTETGQVRVIKISYDDPPPSVQL